MHLLWRSIVRVAIATLVGGTFHVAWIALFIWTASQGGSGVLRAVLWLAAPVITAAGFGLGLTRFHSQDPRARTGLGRAFMTALSGCALGAVLGSPIGPMFVGLGVFGGGIVGAAIWVAADRSGRQRKTGVA